MDILPGIEIVDLALFFPASRTLIFGDVHLGYEKELSLRGVLLPKHHFHDVVARLKPILEATRPAHIILNGDIKHDFGGISDEEWRQCMHLLDLLASAAEVTFVKGNHDTIIRPIADHAKVTVVTHILVEKAFICHGDALFENNPDFTQASHVIIGHEHPALTLHDGIRSERYKCYLRGKYEEKDLIVMPSFAQLHEGTDVLAGELLSPFLQGGVQQFEAFLIPPTQSLTLKESAFFFGRVSKLKQE